MFPMSDSSAQPSPRAGMRVASLTASFQIDKALWAAGSESSASGSSSTCLNTPHSSLKDDSCSFRRELHSTATKHSSLQNRLIKLAKWLSATTMQRPFYLLGRRLWLERFIHADREKTDRSHYSNPRCARSSTCESLDHLHHAHEEFNLAWVKPSYSVVCVIICV